MTTAKTPQPNSMQDLLNSVLQGGYQKSASAGAPNPPTSGPGAGEMDNETTYSPGERFNEQVSHNKETFGPAGADTETSPDSATGELEIPANAAPIKPTGEDPENESSTQSDVAPNVEPGTATAMKLSGDLQNKVAAWREKAAQLVVHLVESPEQLSKEIGGAFGARVKASADALGKIAMCDKCEKESCECKKAADAADQSNEPLHPYIAVMGEDEAAIKEAMQAVTEELANARLFGREMGRKVAAYLNSVAQPAPRKKQSAMHSVISKIAMGEGMPPEAMGGEGGEMLPPEAMGGGGGGEAMPPEMSGGGGGGAEDPAMIAQALQELAAEMGMAPEELAQMLMAELEGGGEMGGDSMAGGDMGGAMGGGDMSGAGGPPPAPEAQPSPDSGSDQSGGSSKSDDSSKDKSDSKSEDKSDSKSEDSSDKESMAKYAAAKELVKKQARQVVTEIARRGSRRA